LEPKWMLCSSRALIWGWPFVLLKGQVWLAMFNYIHELLLKCPDDLMKGASSTPGAHHLIAVNPDGEKLNQETSIIFHHLTAKLLYLLRRMLPDLQLLLSFLTKQVVDTNDWNKLGRCLHYLRDTCSLPLMWCDRSGVVCWWVDSSFAVHPNMHSHTGAAMSIGFMSKMQ
jgi:hypothetical protein